MKKISIIIVTYNSEKDIYDCLNSIFKYSDLPKEELEIIIVDNNSKEQKTMFEKLRLIYGSDIILIENTTNGGYGQGNNLGISKSTAPIILIMNPDVRLIKPIFKSAVEAFERNKKLSIYGMKQMLTPSEPSTNSFACTYMMNGYLFTIITALCTRLDFYIPNFMYFSGSCFYIRKSIFVKIGMFDESVFLYGEEDDIHYRIKKIFGANMEYNKKLRYIHITKDRRPNIEYEKTLVDVALLQAGKKGYPRQKMLRNRLQNTNALLARLWINRHLGRNIDEEQLLVLQGLKQYILKLMKGGEDEKV